MSNSYNIPSIKQSIAARAEDYLRELFGERLKRDGQGWRVGTHGSLHAEIKNGELVFHDHESGQGGDSITLWARERGGDNGSAIKSCAAWAGITGHSGSFTPSPRTSFTPKVAAIYAMTDAELKRAAKAAEKLGTSPSLCAGIATQRGWKWQTIQQLASECSLGVDGGKLAFIYPTGIKLRWQEHGERRFAFACGKPHAFWRSHLRESGTTRAIIAEGETDALRLIDLGYDDGTTRVFSVPSASTWPLDWKKALAGLDEVIFALDADEAGQRHVAEWAALIRPHVGKVRAINWQEVTK